MLRDKRHHILFFDNAKNNKSGDILVNLLSHSSEFAKFGIFEVYYLVEYHGKTELDGEFGRIKMALKVVRLKVVINGGKEMVVEKVVITEKQIAPKRKKTALTDFKGTKVYVKDWAYQRTGPAVPRHPPQLGHQKVVPMSSQQSDTTEQQDELITLQRQQLLALQQQQGHEYEDRMAGLQKEMLEQEQCELCKL